MQESLYKIFYSNHKAHKATYLEGFSSPSSVHLPFNIKQFNHDKSFQAFFYYSQDLALLMQNIYTSFTEFLNIISNISHIVLQQLSLSCLIDEVHSTSSIEGIHSTHRELKDILDGNSNSRHFSSIIKKYDLLSSGHFSPFRSPKDIRAFYDEFAHDDIAADNPKNKLDGTLFRKEAVDVRSASGKIIHRGLVPEQSIIDAMSCALDFLNDDNFPMLVRIAVFHYLFAYIHPFYDGNGRTARFISSAYIAKHLHPIIALSLAVTIKKRQKHYYSMLKETDAEINCGDLTPFICGFLAFITDTIHDINRKLKRKISQLERFRDIFRNTFYGEDINSLIMDLLLQASTFYGRGLSMDELMTFTGKSRNTIKAKFLSLPVRCLTAPSSRKKFYKINWKAIRLLTATLR